MDGSMFMTVEDAARVFRISEKTVRRQIKNGNIPAMKIGGSLRIPIWEFCKSVWSHGNTEMTVEEMVEKVNNAIGPVSRGRLEMAPFHWNKSKRGEKS